MRKIIKNLIDETFCKFIVVGVINTLLGTSIMFLFYNIFHLSYWISSASNYFFGSILSYFLNKNFTFKNKVDGFRNIIYFILNISICYLVAYGIAKPVVKYVLSSFGKVTQENVAMFVGMCLFVVMNYLGQRFIVFGKSK
jgi:hypothetical protein